MLRVLIVAALVGAPAGLAAEEVWTPLDGAAIGAALEGRWLHYDEAAQFFAAGGGTTYGPSAADQTSAGRWRVERDRYCSVWPPSDLWACYDMAENADGSVIRFISGDGSTTDGHYLDGP